MPETYQQSTVARSLALAAGVNVLDADIAKTQADPAATGALGPLFRVGAGSVKWAVIPVASSDVDAEPIDGQGMLVDAAMVQRHQDANGALLGFSRPPSTADSNNATRTPHHFEIVDSEAVRGNLVYLSVLSIDNVGSIAAVRIIAVSGLGEAT